MSKPKDTSSIKLNLAKKLTDEGYRRAFFRLRTQDNVAEQIRGMREIRKLNQKQLAELSGMKQSAVSRIEQADYNSWTLNTLLRVADALDAHVKVEFEKAEEVIHRFSLLEEHGPQSDKLGVSEGSDAREYMEWTGEYRMIGHIGATGSPHPLGTDGSTLNITSDHTNG